MAQLQAQMQNASAMQQKQLEAQMNMLNAKMEQDAINLEKTLASNEMLTKLKTESDKLLAEMNNEATSERQKALIESQLQQLLEQGNIDYEKINLQGEQNQSLEGVKGENALNLEEEKQRNRLQLLGVSSPAATRNMIGKTGNDLYSGMFVSKQELEKENSKPVLGNYVPPTTGLTPPNQGTEELVPPTTEVPTSTNVSEKIVPDIRPGTSKPLMFTNSEGTARPIFNQTGAKTEALLK